MRLYQWNVEISGALYEALHLFEVILRNAIDAEISTWNSSQTDPAGVPHSADWLMDTSHLLNRLAGTDIAKATERARKALNTGKPGGRAPGHPDVVAQLSFGTWRFLLPDRDQGKQLLWSQAINRAFPHLPAGSAPTQLVRYVDGIYRLRNRIAHLEPMLRNGLIVQQLKAMTTVLKYIDPAVQTWFASRQRVTPVLSARPR